MPQRIQLRRVKGWKMSPNCVKVSRPTRWGNPFKVEFINNEYVVTDGKVKISYPSKEEAHKGAVRLYRAYLDNDGTQYGAIRDDGGAFLKILAKEELRGKDLACFCPIGLACHADILLEISNNGD